MGSLRRIDQEQREALERIASKPVSTLEEITQNQSTLARAVVDVANGIDDLLGLFRELDDVIVQKDANLAKELVKVSKTIARYSGKK